MKKNKITFFLALTISIFFMVCCEEDKPSTAPATSEPGMPEVTTLDVTEITGITAICGGNITDEGDTSITNRGVIWGTSTNLSMENKEGFTEDGTGSGTYTSNITGLEQNTTYYVRAYASNNNGEDYSYGEEKEFKTKEIVQSITITNPKDKQTLEVGKYYYIKWEYEGIEGNARISLYKGKYNGSSVIGSSLYKTIADVDCSEKQYRWTISDDIEAGTYTLYISVANIHAAITIEIEIPAFIEVTKPTSTTRWGNDYRKHIEWESYGAGDKVKIELYYKASNGYESVYKTIASSTENDGDYSWKVDTYYICEYCYRIKITSLSNRWLYDYSDYFSIPF